MASSVKRPDLSCDGFLALPADAALLCEWSGFMRDVQPRTTHTTPTGRVEQVIPLSSVPTAAWAALLTDSLRCVLFAAMVKPAVYGCSIIHVRPGARQQGAHRDHTAGPGIAFNFAFNTSGAPMTTLLSRGSHTGESGADLAPNPCPALLYDSHIVHAGAARDPAETDWLRSRVFVHFVDVSKPPEAVRDAVFDNLGGWRAEALPVERDVAAFGVPHVLIRCARTRGSLAAAGP